MERKKEINERGTLIWELNCLRSDLMPNLLDDLVSFEKKGLEEEQCDEVKKALSKLVNAAVAIPDGSFLRKAIWNEFECFEKIYHAWNDDERGESDVARKHRKQQLENLRDQRHRIAKTIRKNYAILENELDLLLLKASHQAMADLVTAVPDLFKELGKAVSRTAAKQVKLG